MFLIVKVLCNVLFVHVWKQTRDVVLNVDVLHFNKSFVIFFVLTFDFSVFVVLLLVLISSEIRANVPNSYGPGVVIRVASCSLVFD